MTLSKTIKILCFFKSTIVPKNVNLLQKCHVEALIQGNSDFSNHLKISRVNRFSPQKEHLMSQTHCLLKHGGEFLFSIVGIFEMPLPPVDELSDDSASKAAIKSPEKPTAPAKPKSKPEKPPKQNPKEKAAKVEKNRRCRKNHRRLRNQRQHPRVNLLP